MCEVYVLRYSLSCGTEIISTYETMQGVVSKLKMMALHDHFCHEESLHLTKEEVLTDKEAEERYERVKEHYKGE